MLTPPEGLPPRVELGTRIDAYFMRLNERLTQLH